MYTETKYTAKQVLEAVGVDPEVVLDKVLITIGGIAGIAKANQEIRFPRGTTVVDITVGGESYQLNVIEKTEE